MDETAIALDPVLRNCWMKRGRQRRIPAGISPPVQYLFGGFNWRDGTLSYQLAERHKSSDFIHWLEHLMTDCYPDQKVVLLMDNASWHYSVASQAAIALYEPRLVAIFLPPYAPNLNLIERYWRHLKDRVCADKLYASMDVLRDAIVKELTRQNDLSNGDRFHHAV
jgi:transposase